ncbi:MAG TPA: 4Fe-4S binding protein [Spirochaetota bacterium]|nr:4Fe-4S binding protein [Spirochaetota bacterium]
MENIYIKLRERLDTYSFGFPATESGIEITLLKKLFTESDAAFFLNLSLKLEESENIAERLNMSPDIVKDKLEELASKGVIFRQKSGGKVRYGAIPFMHGVAEFQIKRVDRELSNLLQQFFKEAYNRNIADNAENFLRVIPVQKYVDIERHIAAYNDVQAIFENSDLIVVAECLCRKHKTLLDEGCGRPIETCFMFGSMAQYYIDNKLGRKVEKEEALRIVAEAQKAGCVTQPATSQNPTGLCNCCGDCCAVLGAIKANPKPAEFVFSNYFASIEQEACIGCEACKEICPMEAIFMNSAGRAEVNLDRCIGCGLCLMTCNYDAVKLNEKPEGNRKAVPVNTRDQMIQMAKKRGLI